MENEQVGSIDRVNYRGKMRSQYWTVNEEPSKTVQSDAPEADIIQILRKYKEVGIIDHLKQTEIRYADISEFTDFADAQRHLKVVEAEFMTLPSRVREIFDHDVANWLDTAHDEDKRQALVDAGFIEAPPEAPPTGGGEGNGNGNGNGDDDNG